MWTIAAALMLVTIILPTDGYADSIRDKEWFLNSLTIADAHRYSEGSGIVVAVIDSGVDATHPDLAGSIAEGVDTASGHGNGQVDIGGHGTSMAGLIVGHGHGHDDIDGVLGIAPQARILPVRVNLDTIVSSAELIRGINWAVGHGAKVLCLAIAGADDSPELRRAIKAAQRADIVVVAGVGNTPLSTRVAYPAAYPGVIAAAGTDEHGDHGAVSVTGPEVVLSAPATNIVSTYLHHGYGTGTGTSAATAIVAGVAALVRSRFPKLSAAEVIHRLTATATDRGPPGRDDQYGYGIVNPLAALTADVPPLVTPSQSPSATRTSPAPQSTADARHDSTNPWGIVAVLMALLAVLAVWIAARRRATR